MRLFEGACLRLFETPDAIIMLQGSTCALLLTGACVLPARCLLTACSLCCSLLLTARRCVSCRFPDYTPESATQPPSHPAGPCCLYLNGGGVHTEGPLVHVRSRKQNLQHAAPPPYPVLSSISVISLISISTPLRAWGMSMYEHLSAALRACQRDCKGVRAHK